MNIKEINALIETRKALEWIEINKSYESLIELKEFSLNADEFFRDIMKEHFKD